MKMAYSSTFYPGALPRPRAEYHLNEEGNMLCTCVTWGNGDAYKVLLDSLQEPLPEIQAETQITVPFADSSSLKSDLKSEI